jgi:hypothetical protein
MPKLRLATLAVAALASGGCAAERPAWADGAEIRSERPANAPPQDLRDIPARILAAHNRERVSAGVPPLAWDPALAAAAAVYAPQLAQLPTLAHSPRATRRGQGENLWRGTGGAFGVDEILGSWAAERRLFRPGTFPNVSTSGEWSDVSHYTQMIWPTTTRVGCAFHRSGRWDYLVCRYAPAGNVAGQRVP